MTKFKTGDSVIIVEDLNTVSYQCTEGKTGLTGVIERGNCNEWDDGILVLLDDSKYIGSYWFKKAHVQVIT